MKRWLFIVVLVQTLTGCAGKMSFFYEHSQLPQVESKGPVLCVEPLIDVRTGPKNIDRIFKKPPLESINEIVLEEMKSTGLFSKVFLLPKEKINDVDYLKSTNADLLMKCELLEMKYIVPSDEEFDLSFLVPVIFPIYSLFLLSSKTEVNGNTKLKISLINLQMNNSILNYTYTGLCKEEKPSEGRNSSSTVAEMIGKSLKIALEKFKDHLNMMITSSREKNP